MLLTGTVVLIVLGAVLLGLGKSSVFDSDAVTTFVPATDFLATSCEVVEVEATEKTVKFEYETSQWPEFPDCKNILGKCPGEKCQDVFRFKFKVAGAVASAQDIVSLTVRQQVAQSKIDTAQTYFNDETATKVTSCNTSHANYTELNCEYAEKYVTDATNKLDEAKDAKALLPSEAQPETFWSGSEVVDRGGGYPKSCKDTELPVGNASVVVGVGESKECWTPTMTVNVLNEAYDCTENSACNKFLKDPNADVAPVVSSALKTTAKVLAVIGTILIPVGFLFPCCAVLCCMVKKPMRMRQNPPGVALASDEGGGLGRYGFGNWNKI